MMIINCEYIFIAHRLLPLKECPRRVTEKDKRLRAFPSGAQTMRRATVGGGNWICDKQYLELFPLELTQSVAPKAFPSGAVRANELLQNCKRVQLTSAHASLPIAIEDCHRRDEWAVMKIGR